VLKVQDIELDPAARTRAQGRQAAAAAVTREFDLLQALMLNCGRVLSREQLEQHLYSWGREVESNAVEVHVAPPAAQAGQRAIQTVRGVGYTLLREAPA
jgi:two-component system OmpR family response regulator/two-component system response regulator QseB